MATVKVKFRPSKICGGQGVIFYQVIHHRVVRRLKTDYRLQAAEWDSRMMKVVLTTSDESRRSYLMEISSRIAADIRLFSQVVYSLKSGTYAYTADDVVLAFAKAVKKQSFFSFMDEVTAGLKALGRIRTSETYATTLSSFKRFRAGRDLRLDEMDSDMMLAYEAYLRSCKLSPNTSSFYMRILRAVYNRAVEKELVTQRFPFRHVYTGVDKTVKRAIPLNVVRQIKELNLSMNPSLDFARDMFLFSFYTRGMSFVDMAYLRKADLNGGVLSYRRRKTGQQLFVKWEKSMQAIVDKYDTSQSDYLLPVIKPNACTNEFRQYIYASHNVNRSLKILGRQLGLPLSLTMYVGRHAWASIAWSKNVPLSVISEGMGHNSEATTRIYLASLDTMAVDKANEMILESLGDEP